MTEDTLRSYWEPSPEAIRAALEASGTPPELDMRGMLQAAFAVDGQLLLVGAIAPALRQAVRDVAESLDRRPPIAQIPRQMDWPLTGAVLRGLLEWVHLAPATYTLPAEAGEAEDRAGMQWVSRDNLEEEAEK